MYFQQPSPYSDQTTDGYNRGGGQPENYLGDISNQLRQTTNQRVAAAMYPEAIDNSTHIPSTQYDGHQTAVQKLAEPSQMLVHAVVNLINYQDDADLATRALPELIKLLNDEDQVVMSQAAIVVYQLAKKQASRHALCNSAPLVKALLQTLERSNDLETTKYASEILQSLSQNQQGLLAIFKTGGIRALIHALNSPIDGIVFNALSTIHNLLLHQEGAKMTVRLNGGLQKLVNLLQRDNYKFLAIVADCLHLLAYGSQEGKLIILASGGPAELVRILHSYNYEKLLFTTARVMKVLSVCPSNKPALIQAGGVQALALCLNHPSKRLVQECLWALRNLSDGATKEINLEPLIQKLLQLLESNDINLITCAAGTISNLTCNNPNIKNFACKMGAIQTLVQTIRDASDRDEIIEPAVCALRHLTNSHPDVEIARESLRLQGGLSDISKLLEPTNNWPILTATSGLVRNLAANQDSIITLRELGVIQKLSILVNNAYQTQQGSPEESVSTSVGFAGIKAERIFEGLIGALHVLAADYQSRVMMSSMNILTTLISLFYNDNERVVLITLDLLAELAREPEVTSKFESQGGLPILTGLLSSPSEAIRQRAGLLFSLVSGDKTPEYTQRLSNEINTLFQSGVNDGSNWKEAQPNRDFPSVYNVEGQLNTAPSVHSGESRQDIYNTGSTTYVTQHDIDAGGYGRTGHINRAVESSDAARHGPIMQQQPQQGEPWFDTDL